MMGGLLIKEGRLRAGLTQAQLAERMGTSQPAVARWENGRRQPTLDTIVRALLACDLDLEVRINKRDDSDEMFFVQTRAMTPDQRLRALENLLEVERWAHQAKRVDVGA